MWTGQRTTFFEEYDVTSGVLIYGRMSHELVAPKPLKTSGSSTTIVEVTTGDGPFASLGVGDRISVQPGADTTVVNRTVTAIASDASATINTAADFENVGAGRHFRFRRFLSGTAATDGWVARGKWDTYDVHIVIATLNATNIQVSIEGRNVGVGTSPRRLLAVKTYTAAGDSGTDIIPIGENCDEIRVGVLVTGDAGAQSLSIYGVGRSAA